jgi:hypothetical protein
MAIRSVGADLFMGQMEEQTGQRILMKLKENYRYFSKAPITDEYQFVTGLGFAFRAFFVKLEISNLRRKMM